MTDNPVWAARISGSTETRLTADQSQQRHRLAVTRQKQLHKGRERLVEEPLRLRSDGVEDQRVLPAARDAGEDGDLPKGNVE
jgi:hypothetical protein